jgi:serine protease DegS
MQFQKFLPFALISIAAGLAAAFLALFLLQEPADDSPAERQGTASILPAGGPVSYAAAVRKATPSVVNIYTAKVTVQQGKSLFNDPFFQRFFGDRINPQPQKKLQTSLGSGVIINTDGYILTNHHVIKDADEIRVVLSNGTTIQAELVGADPDTDLAVLRTDSEELPAISVGDSNALQMGDVVLAIGNPFGVGQAVSMGIVSAIGRNQLGINTYENFIQTDAAINPGNSGGALINAHGELVGINTAIFSKSGGSHGIGFAIPVKLAKGVMQQILTQGRVIRGWLGISGQDMTPALAESFNLKETKGVLVSGVLEHGPADQAGIEPGDVITQIDDRSLQSAHDVLNIVAMRPPGSTVTVSGWRGDQPLEIEVVVSERPAATR